MLEMNRGESLTSACCGVLRDRCICSHAVNLQTQGMSGEQRRSINTNATAWLKLRGAVFLQLSHCNGNHRLEKIEIKKKKKKKKYAQFSFFSAALLTFSDSESL